jgi:hypothetical protein
MPAERESGALLCPLVIRKHAVKLRQLVILLAFAVPIVALLLSLGFSRRSD